jgi:hypothetical protein
MLGVERPKQAVLWVQLRYCKYLCRPDEGQRPAFNRAHKAGASQCHTHTFYSIYTIEPPPPPLYALAAHKTTDRSPSCAQLLFTRCTSTIRRNTALGGWIVLVTSH